MRVDFNKLRLVKNGLVFFLFFEVVTFTKSFGMRKITSNFQKKERSFEYRMLEMRYGWWKDVGGGT